MARLICAALGHEPPEYVPFFGASRCPRCHALLDDDHVRTPIDGLREKR